MSKLLTGLQCLQTFSDGIQSRIVKNMRSYLHPDSVLEWLLDEDYEDPKEFLGSCVNFSLNGEEEKQFWEAVYNKL